MVGTEGEMKLGTLVLVLVAHLGPTLCDPADCSPPGFSVHGILQARLLEWVAIPFSRREAKINRNKTGERKGWKM